MSTGRQRRIRLALLFGGRSPEHEVSVISARSVRQALDSSRFEVVPIAIGRDGRWLPFEESRTMLNAALDAVPLLDDGTLAAELVPSSSLGAAVDVVFPILHGPFGEDGTIQGLLELLDVPYVGAGVAGSAVGMDKALMKSLFQQRGLPVLPYETVKASHWRRDRAAVLRNVQRRLQFPVFVKPANMGSSIGVSRVDGASALVEALELALSYDTKVLVEAGVPGFREIECGVLGNDDPEVSVPGEILIHSAFYDYQTKYTDGAAALQIPAQVRAETGKQLQQIALAAFDAVDAAGMARVDFLVAPDESQIWLNEINTIPGFTPYSMYPLLWQGSGISYPDLIARLVDLALERHDERSTLRHDRLPERDR